MSCVESEVERVFREEHGRIIATLIRRCGSFDLAQEAMQDALVAALTHWREHGMPDSPAAWITTTANRKLIDIVRRARTRRDKQVLLCEESETTEAGGGMSEEPSQDRLRLIFTCCHPALSPEARIALTLRTLGGLRTDEIARAFLVSESTLAQRLVRAQHKIHAARIPYEIPPPLALAERLSSVLAVIYLIFNEGYVATSGAQLVRHDLCAEAIRLARMLNELRAGDPESMGLLALMLLHDSRRTARVSGTTLMTLEEQDRQLWDQAQIREGLGLIEAALRMGRPGPYQLQAAIAAVHAEAAVASETDWRQIAALYAELETINPTPVVALNRAAAIGMSEGPPRGLELMDALSDMLDRYHLFHAARADLLRRLGDREGALQAYGRAQALTENEAERAYLERRVRALTDRLS